MPAIEWPFITSVFSFLSLAKKRLYYYVKLCLWKHKSAPLLRSPSPGKHDSTSHFSHSGWKTVFIEAMCVPTSCLIMFLGRILQPYHNTFQVFTKCRNKHKPVMTYTMYLVLCFSDLKIEASAKEWKITAALKIWFSPFSWRIYILLFIGL